MEPNMIIGTCKFGPLEEPLDQTYKQTSPVPWNTGRNFLDIPEDILKERGCNMSGFTLRPPLCMVTAV